MEISKTVNNGKAIVSIEGRLDTLTSPEALDTLTALLNEAPDLTINMEKITYVSSAGLRVIIAAQKKAVAGSGSLTLTGVPGEIMEIFEMTGLKSVLNFGG